MTHMRIRRAVMVFLVLVLVQAVSIAENSRAESEGLRLEKLNLNIGRIESDFAKLLKERDELRKEISSMRDQMRGMREKNVSLSKKLKGTLEAANQKIEKFNSQKKRLVTKLNAFNDRFKEMNDEMEKLEDSNDSLAEDLEKAQKTGRTAAARLSSGKRKFQEEISFLKNKVGILSNAQESLSETLADTKKSSHEKILKLSTQKKNLISKMFTLNDKLRDAHARLKKLASAKASLKETLAATKSSEQERIESLAAQKNDLVSKLSASDTKLKNMEATEAELARAKASLEELTAEKADFNVRSKTSEAKIKELTDANTSLNDALAATKMVNAHKIEQLTTEKNALASKYSALDIKLQDSEARVNELVRAKISFDDTLGAAQKVAQDEIDALAGQNKELTTQLTATNDKLQYAQAKIAELAEVKTSLKETTAKKDELASRLSALGIELRDSKSKMSKLERSKTSLTDKLTGAKKAVEQNKRRLNKDKDTLHKKISSLRGHIKDLGSQKLSLTKQLRVNATENKKHVSELRGQRDDLVSKLSAAEEKFENSQAVVDKLARAKAEVNTEKRDLVSKLSALETKLKSSEMQIGKLSEAKSALTGKNNDLVYRLHDLDAKLKNSETQISEQTKASKTKICELTRASEAEINELTKASGAKIDELTKAKAALNSERDDLTSRLSALDIKYKDSQSKIDELTSAKADLSNKFSAAKRTHKEKVETLIAQKNELASRISGFEGKLKGSEAQINEVTFSRTMLEDQIDNLETEKLSLSEKLEKTTSEDKREIEKLNTQKNDLISRVSDLDMKLRDSETRVDKLVKARFTLNNTLAATRAANKKKIEMLVGQKNKLASKLSDLDIKLIKSGAKIDELVKTKVTLDGTLSATREVDQKKIEALIGQKEDLSYRLSALGIKLKDSVAKIDELTRSRAAMANRFTAAKKSDQEKIETLIQHRNKLSYKISRLSDKLKDSETQIGEVIFSRTILEDRIEDLSREKIVLSKKLEETTEMSQQQIAELTGQNNDLVSRLAILDDKLKDSEANALSSTKEKPGSIAEGSASLGRRTGSLNNDLIDLTSRNNYLIKILSGKSQAVRKPADTAGASERINFDIKDADIKDILDAFAQLYDVEIIAEDEVEGKVSINLINMEPYKALEATLEKCGYVYSIREDVIIVRKAKE